MSMEFKNVYCQLRLFYTFIICKNSIHDEKRSSRKLAKYNAGDQSMMGGNIPNDQFTFQLSMAVQTIQGGFPRNVKYDLRLKSLLGNNRQQTS